MLKLHRSNTSNKKKKKGQSTVEYILLAAAVIAMLVLFLGPSGPFSETLESTLNQTVTDMGEMGNRLSGSRPLSNAN